MSLALKYRPKTFERVIGQGLTPVVLQRMVELGEVPDGLLFVGPPGTGKTSTARILASAMDAELIELDGASNGSVADIRELTKSLQYGNASRLIVLDEAHAISKEGFNALLKALEEPYPGVRFVLITTEPKKILPTVKSRLIEFEFLRVSRDVLMQHLGSVVQIEKMTCEVALLEFLAVRANGSVRSALMLLDQCRLAGISTLKEFTDLQGLHDFAPDLISAIASGNPAATDAVLDMQLRTARTPQTIVGSLVACLRDVQVLRSQGTIHATDDALVKRQAIASSITPEQAFGGLNTLWVYQANLASSEDPTNDLRLVCAMLEKQLHVGRELL